MSLSRVAGGCEAGEAEGVCGHWYRWGVAVGGGRGAIIRLYRAPSAPFCGYCNFICPARGTDVATRPTNPDSQPHRGGADTGANDTQDTRCVRTVQNATEVAKTHGVTKGAEAGGGGRRKRQT
eukprot:2103842-Prymnesium_polylepis.1